MSITNYKIDRPSTWQMFEKLCHLVWWDILQDPGIQLNGRTGQPQCGVDIYGTDENSKKFTCVQCKGKDENLGSTLTEKELRDEVNKAKNFSPMPDVFYLATTAANDAKIQQVARQITIEHRKTGLFEVIVIGWEDLVQRIATSNRAISEFYPHLTAQHLSINSKLGELGIAVDEIKKAVTTAKNELTVSPGELSVSFKNGSQGLFNWPRTLQVNQKWMERREEENIIAKISSAYYSTTVLLGEPGVGKSALLSKIGQNLEADGNFVIAIKADQLSHAITDFSTLSIELGFPAEIDKCILKASSIGPVFLIVDQLDTISELVDVKTSRLSVLLGLIRTLSQRPNVHIIASSRPFEFNHDVRFSSIKADKVILQPLEWPVVDEVLKSLNLTIQTNEQFKQFLCKPSNLNFYLKYIESNPEKTYLSHLELYNDIWSNSLGEEDHKSRRKNFLQEIATQMTNEAQQSLSITVYEDYISDIEWLCGQGLLVKDINGKNFSFAHQTLQAFVWTKSFIKDGKSSLLDFVLTHQNNLNIRPKLQTALFYLREEVVDTYNDSLKSLFDNATSIRRHILYLALDCICAHNSPNLQEVQIIKSVILDDTFSPRIARNISDKPKWFDELKAHHIPALMKGSDKQQYAVCSMLASALNLRTAEAVLLLHTHWLTKNHLNQLYYALRDCVVWNDSTYPLAKFLVEQEGIVDYVVSDLTKNMLRDKDFQPFKLFAHYLNTRIEKIRLNSEADSNTSSDSDNSMSSYRLKREYEQVLELGHSFHDLTDLVAQYPRYFLDSAWPVFVRGCELTWQHYYEEYNAYQDVSGSWFHLEDEDSHARDNYFSTALEKAITLFAQKNSSEFVSFFLAEKHCEFMPVHRLLIKGIEKILETHSDVAFQYILEDSRRLKIGSHYNGTFLGSISLISKLAPYLNQEKLDPLCDFILRFQTRQTTSADSAENKRYKLNDNRRAVAVLLGAIPSILLSPRAKDFMDSLQRSYGEGVKKDTSGGHFRMTGAKSAMSVDQMKAAKDEHILSLLVKYDDKTEHDWGWRWITGTECARTFGKFATECPHRAINILSRLGSKNLNAITEGIQGLAKSDISIEKLLSLILACENNGLNSGYFYEEMSSAIEAKIAIGNELPDTWCVKMKSWLPIVFKECRKDVNIETSDDEKRNEESIFWGISRPYFIPAGCYRVLSAITSGYLVRKMPATKDWCCFIKEQISQNYEVNHWHLFLAAHFKRIFWMIDALEVSQILDLLVAQYPNITSDEYFALGVLHAFRRATPEKIQKWLELIYQSGTNLCSQMYGEMLGIKIAINPNDTWCQEKIDLLIGSKSDEYALKGLGYSLKNVWPSHKFVTPLIVRLFDLDIDVLSDVLMGLFRFNEKLVPSIELSEILDAILRNGSLRILKNDRIHIARTLKSIVSEEPERIATMCFQIIDLYGQDLGNIATAASADAGDLIDIALTLHNSGPKYQRAGIDIFEKLLDLEVYKINDVLGTIDNVPIIRRNKTATIA